MADKADDINQRVEEQTSFGNYIFKDLLSTGSVLLGVAVGAGLGFAASKWKPVSNLVKKGGHWLANRIESPTTLGKQLTEMDIAVGELKQGIKGIADKQVTAEVVTSTVGMFAGAFAGGVPHTYLHWKHGRVAQLHAEELAKDVAEHRGQREAIANELNEQARAIRRQNDAIEKILAQGPATPASLKSNPTTPLEQLEQERSNPATPERS